MRALILSDIHANIDALDAVLQAAPPHDAVWNLGDIVGYNAAPQAVLERARQIGEIFVRGNHDRACARLTGAADFNSVAFRAVQWTRNQLDPDSMDWLRALPQGPVYPRTDSFGTEREARPKSDTATPDPSQDAGPQIVCVHGSLLDEDEYLLSTRDAERQMAQARGRIAFFGHTHVQGGFAANGEGEWFPLQPVYTESDRAESYDLDLREGAVYLINPGAVGQPRDRDWRAAFALYDQPAARVTYFRVPYDVRLAQMRIQRAGLPDMLASRLRVGR